VTKLFTFPNPVNEKAARTVAAGVALLSALLLTTGWMWLSIVLSAGFMARVAAGPRLSLLGQLATRVIAPRLGRPKLVPGPPKRFAQSIGAVLSSAGVVAYYGFGAKTVVLLLIGAITVAATLEAIFAICLGCLIFGWLMSAGLIRQEICEACNDIRLRYREAA
jgi:hypothetical protein